MTIQLNPEQESLVGQAMRAGLIRTFDDVAEVGLAAIRQKLNAQRPASLDADQWLHELVAWSEGHAIKAPLLPDEALERDSIYGSHGL